MSDFRVDGNKLLFHLPELNKWKRGEFVAPLFIDLGINNICNYRCVHCAFDYNQHKQYFIKREPLLRLMRDMGEAGVKSILVGGTGEPTMNRYFAEAIEEGKRSGLDIALTTNGALLNYEKLERVLPLLTWMRFSMLAVSEEYYNRLHRPNQKNAREKVLENLKSAVEIKRKHGLDVTISVYTCVFDDNVDDMENLVAQVKSLGVDYVMIKPPSVNAKNENEIKVGFNSSKVKHLESYADENFKVLIRWNFFDNGEREYSECLGLPFIYQIDGNGGVYTCGGFMENDRYCYGNINETSFKDILKGDKIREVMERAMTMPEGENCLSLCRQHSINKLLFNLKHPPEHVNFI